MAKDEKEEKKKLRIVLPRLPFSLWEGAAAFAATVFLTISFVYMGQAFSAAVTGELAGEARRAAAAASAPVQAETGGQIWFSMPDGTYVNGDGAMFEAPPPVIYEPPSPEPPAPVAPAAPELPVVEETPPEPEEAVQEPEPAAEAPPGAQTWTTMVWVTRLGGSYHSRVDCPEMDPGTPRELPVQEAVALNCLRCRGCW